VVDAERFDRDDPPILGANPFVGFNPFDVVAAWSRLGQRAGRDPARVAATTARTAGKLLQVAAGKSPITPAAGDKRFTHDAWAHNPVYHRLLQTYLVDRDALLEFIDGLDLDHKSRQRSRFAAMLLTEALAPTNTLLGNPDALTKAVQTRGRSLVSGARHALSDLWHNGGMPSTVDPGPFEVGVNLAVSPGHVIYRTEVFELIQYAPATRRCYERPLVAIPPQINKFYITDLAPGRSLVEHTVAAGIPYFAVSWRNPTPAQRDWNLDTYVSACEEAIRVACAVTGSEDANVVGMCAGGITLACALGHLATTGSSLVNSATFMVTGLDTRVESLTTVLASRAAIEAARSRSQRKGVLDGDDMAKVFAWLRPNDLVWNYWVNNYLLGQSPPAFDILYWNADTTRLPAGLHSDFLELAEGNPLVEPGAQVVLGVPIDLREVTCDAYVVGGTTDHIIPWQSAYRATQLFAGNTEFVLSSSGHIQAIVNPPGNPRASYFTGGEYGPDPEKWREGASRREGSWWENWTGWLQARSGVQRPAPKDPGNHQFAALEPAPGRYVHL
jgi:polyhydroxyalkanoate synthase